MGGRDRRKRELWGYSTLGHLVISETGGGDLGAFDSFYALQLDLAYKLAPKRRAQTGRNDQCPCGSGKKCANCHGA